MDEQKLERDIQGDIDAMRIRGNTVGEMQQAAWAARAVSHGASIEIDPRNGQQSINGRPLCAAAAIMARFYAKH